MLIEATGKHRGPGFGLPAGVYGRQSWRPPALRAVESVLSGISRRNEPLDRRRASLTAWYEQLARRGQPFIGWQPLTTEELGGDSTQLPDGSVQSGDRTARREPQMISTKDRTPEANVSHSAVKPVAQDQRPATHSQRLPAEPQTPQRPFLLLRSISGPMHTAAKSMPPSEAGHAPDPSGTPERPIEEAVQPVAPPEREAPYPVVPPPAAEDRRLAAEDGRLAAEDGRLAAEEGRLTAEDGRLAAEDWRRAMPMAAAPQPHGEQFVRPAMRLAILRPITTGTATMQRSDSGPIPSSTSGFSLVTVETKDLPGLEPLLMGDQPAFQPRLVSSVSSFPRQEVRGGFPVDFKTEVRHDADTSSDGRVGVTVRDTSVFGNNVSPETASLAGSHQVKMPEPSGTIERLISRTVLPVALPGLQIRLVTPDAPEPATQRSAADAAEGGRSTVEVPKGPPPVPPQPPLDINSVADKVYQTLVRRQQFERERRGLY